MSGLDENGFQIERLPEIRSATEDDLTQAFGNIDLRADSIFGQFVGIGAEEWALLWALAEDVYFSQYPDTASGVSLDYVCSLNGVVRFPSRATQVNATAYGVAGTVLSQGREAANDATGDVYRSTATVEINRDAARYAQLTVASIAAGSYTVTVRGVAYTFTATGGESDQQILTGVQAALAGAGVTTLLGSGTLDISDNTGSDMALGVTTNLLTPSLGVIVPMSAIQTGQLSLGVGDLTQIKTPVAGWDAVTNLSPGIIGANRESDGALRARRERSIQITATNTLDAIYSRLSQVANVTDVNAQQNNTDATDANGTLRQHVWAIVEGGDDDAISRVLFDAVAAGIGYRGNEVVEVISEISGKTYLVAFDRPTYIEPTIEIEITKFSGFPAEGEELIRAALVDQAYLLGEKLVLSRLYTPINSVPGFEIDSVLINGGTANLAAAPNEKIRLLGSNITISEAP